jgi:replicative DNA helicase
MLFDLENSVKDITVNSQAEPIKTLGQFVTSAMKRSSAAAKTGKSSGFDTGLSSLDEILGRIHGGDFGVIGARQGDAKTVLALQIARRADAYNIPAALFELEMQGEDLGRRVLAGESSSTVSQIEEGSYDMFAADELEAVRAALVDSKVYIDDRPKLRIDQIRDRCIALKRSKGLGMILVDHLRLVRANGRFANKFDRIEFITGEMKSLAKELDIAVVALSQVTRLSQRRDDPSPQLNDFDGGSSIEQDADWAVGMFRRDRWLKTQRPYDIHSKEGQDWAEQYAKHRGKIEVRCLKRRRGDDGEMREFTFDGRRGMILEIEK